MSATVTCPVCEKAGIPAKSESCPQCDADLSCFQALETLAEKNKNSGSAEKATESEQGAARKDSPGGRYTILLLLLLLLLIGASSLFYILKVKDRVQELKQRVVALKSDLQTAEKKTESTAPRLCVLPGLDKVHSAEANEEDEDAFAEDDPLIYAEDLEKQAESEERGEDGAKKEEGHEESVAESAASTITETITEQDEPEQESEKEVSVARTENTRIKKTQSSELLPKTEEKEKKETANDKLSISMKRIPVIKATAVKKELLPSSEHSSEDSEDALSTAAEKENPLADVINAEEHPRPLLLKENWSEKTFLYLVKETDTLWDLAERFYGDGKYYPVIMEQNPGLVISRLHDEEILRLFNDRDVLKDIYSHRIERRNGLTLWKHQVLAGENRQSIEKRFASPGAAGKVLYEKEPNIYPGAVVRVILH